MNKSALILMFLLVVLAGAFALWQRDSSTTEETPRSPLEMIDYSSIRRISCQREELPAWTLEKHGSTLDLVSEAVAGGRRVAGDPAMRSKIVGFLQDARWTEVRDVADMNLSEWGLEPPLMTVEIEDASGEHAFDVGKADMNKDVWLRSKGGAMAFKYPARIVTDLGLEVNWYRDPKLADIPVHLVEEIRVQPRDAAAYTFKRAGMAWMIEIEGGPTLRADPLIADQLTVTFSNLGGQPDEDSQIDPAAEAEFKVEVIGAGRSCKYQILSAGPAGVLARRGDEPDVRNVDPLLARYFEKNPAVFEDQSVVGLDLADLRLIEISGAGQDPLRLGRSGDYWRLLFGNRIVRPVDPDAFREFRELLLTIRSEESAAETTNFEAARTVRFEFDADLQIPALLVEFSAPLDGGHRWARRSDHDRVMRVGPEISRLLDTRYWDLMVRYLGSGDADKITKLGLEGPDGRGYKLVRLDVSGRWRVVDETQDGKTIEGFEWREVPATFCEVLLDRLAQLAVPRYIGEKSPAELEEIFGTPRYRITWSSEELLLVEPTGPYSPRLTEEKYWEIGTRLDDNHLHGRMSNFPALVFPVHGDALLPVTDTLRLLGQ